MKVYVVHERLKINQGNDLVFLREIFLSEEKARLYCEHYAKDRVDEQKAFSLLGVFDRMFTISEMDVIE